MNTYMFEKGSTCTGTSKFKHHAHGNTNGCLRLLTVPKLGLIRAETHLMEGHLASFVISCQLPQASAIVGLCAGSMLAVLIT